MKAQQFNLFLTFLFFIGINIQITYSQQPHFKNTTKYLAQAKVSGRTTWNMNDTVQLISIDQFNEKGNKTEAYEFYYGKRFLRRYVNSDWRNIHDTTHFSFKYDLHGRQTEQLNHDFIADDHYGNYQMYQYDSYGNIERWITGRSFQLGHKRFFNYDQYENVSDERTCWTDSCESQTMDHRYMSTYGKHYLKYNDKKLVVEDLMNYVDGMAGYQFEYTFNESGRMINMKQYRVWSFDGLDHDVPIAKDIDQRRVYYEWKYEYNSQGQLSKETRMDHWMETDSESIFTYNNLGLMIESLINGFDLIKYSYNDQGLVLEEKHYYRWDGKDRLHTSLKFEYAYRY